MKVSTIFLFAFYAAVEAPSFYSHPDEPKWKAAVAVAVGAIPMLLVGYVTAPYVAYVHIKAPTFARASREALMKWAKNMPGNTELDLTTMRAYGRLRVSRMTIEDLKPTRSWLSIANVTRRPVSLPSATRVRWWTLRPISHFYIGPERTDSRGQSIMQLVMEKVNK